MKIVTIGLATTPADKYVVGIAVESQMGITIRM